MIKNKILVTLIIVMCATLLLMSCKNVDTTQDKIAIEQTLMGYVSSYNDNNFGKTVTYFTGYGDKQDAIDYLAFLKNMSGNLTIVNFDRDSIAVTGNTAKAPVDFIMMGELSFQWIKFNKVDSDWFILWEW